MADNGTKLAINSHADVQRVWREQENSRLALIRNQQQQRLSAAVSFVNNLNIGLGMRSEVLRFLMDGPRDIDSECGYPPWLTPDHYRVMYDREGIAKRVIECEPNECWAHDPEIFDDDDPAISSPFEKAWADFQDQWNAWALLHQLDVLSGIGQFGITMFGLSDGMDLAEPVEGIADDGTGQATKKLDVLFVRSFSEEVCFVKTREININNPRYGLPTSYIIQFRDFPNWGVQAGEVISRTVHWTRCIHAADNKKMSPIYGIPRCQQVYNRLYDLRKIYAANGEGFWKGAFPGITFEVNPELADQGVELDAESIRSEFQKYQDGLQRYLAIQGVTAKQLAPQVVDPTPSVEAQLKAIAIAKAIPYRVLFGSEEAKLASDEDSRAWHKRMKRRQNKYCTPGLVRPFVDRLIQYGVLPKPQDIYKVDWPDLNTPTDLDRAQVAQSRTASLAQYVQSGADQLMPPEIFLTMVMGYSKDETDKILEAMEEYIDENQPQELDEFGNPIAPANPGEEPVPGGEQDVEGPEGTLGKPPVENVGKAKTKRYDEDEDEQEEKLGGGQSGSQEPPDNGNALDMPNLTRKGIKKPVESQPVILPSINRRRSKK